MICSRAIIIILIPILLILQACNLPNDTGGDREDPPQTRIIEILKIPVNIAPEDTASFTCIIEDSLDSRFTFSWLIDDGKVLGADKVSDSDYNAYKSENNNIKWIAPKSTGYYQFSVFVNNGSEDSVSVQGGFSINVEK
jgi:hypothetical protein